MSLEKFLTQAVFATVLAIMALLPVTTYGCLKLQEVESRDSQQTPANGLGG